MKFEYDVIAEPIGMVALFARAWIEINRLLAGQLARIVALFARAWIEMDNANFRLLQ